jgi:SAM-dependent methyltransferase
MPVPHDVQDHYDVPVGEYWTASSMRWSEGYFDSQIAQFRGLWSKPDRPAALDIGAGAGMAMVSLEKAGFATYGLEPSRSFRETAIAMNGVPPEQLRLGGIEDAQFEDEAFDFVTFGAVLEHLPGPAEALGRALQWTRPGGLIHAEVPSSDWLMAKLLDGVYRVQGLDYTTHLSPLHVPYHLFEFTPAAFAAYARRTGCEVAFCRRFVGLTYAPRWLAPVLSKAMNATGTGLQLEIWLRKPAR